MRNQRELNFRYVCRALARDSGKTHASGFVWSLHIPRFKSLPRRLWLTELAVCGRFDRGPRDMGAVEHGAFLVPPLSASKPIPVCSMGIGLVLVCVHGLYTWLRTVVCGQILLIFIL